MENMDSSARAAVLDQIRYLTRSGDPDEAVNLAREVLGIWRTAGVPDEQTYRVRQRVGEALIQAGRYDEAMSASNALCRTSKMMPISGLTTT